MKLLTGLKIANKIKETYPGHYIIVGSILRGAKEINDIDLISLVPIKKVHKEMNEMFPNHEVTQTGTKHHFFIHNGVKFNIWYVTKKKLPYAYFWLSYPAAFNQRIRKHFKEKGYKLSQDGLYKDNQLIPIKYNRDIFNLLNELGYNYKYRSAEEQEKQEAKKAVEGGAFSDIVGSILSLPKNIYTVLTQGIRKKAPPHFREFMIKNGALKIVSLKACREPVQQVVQQMLSLMTLGKWDEEKHKYNYDTMYHVYLLLNMNNGRQVLIEKNQVLNITFYDEDPRSQNQKACVDLPTPTTPIPLLEFFNNAANAVGDSIYLYSGKDNNCQVFLYNLLKYNNLLTNEFKDFIMQNTQDMVNSLPPITQQAMQSATDLAAIWDVILHGEGMKKGKKKKKKI